MDSFKPCPCCGEWTIEFRTDYEPLRHQEPMNLNKDKSELVSLIKAHLLFQKRLFLYWAGEDFKIKDKIYCNGEKYLGTFDHKMEPDEIWAKVNYIVNDLMEGPHIRSSLEPSLPVMRMNMDDD